MDSYEPFASLGIALAAGLLIGLERERSASIDGSGQPVAGVRTHPIVALLGGVSVLLARDLGLAIPIVVLLALTGFLVLNYAKDLQHERDPGITSELALLVSFLLGALALSRGVVEPPARRILVVAASAVVVTMLLSAKPWSQAFARRISADDVAATLKFLIVAVVVLPLLPNDTYGPLDVLNPRHIGVLVVLIAGISFVGYAAMRVLGPERGLGLTGFVGGLASSTAVTLSMSSRAKEEPSLRRSCALAVVLASTIMVARVAIVVGITNRALLGALTGPLLAMGVASTGACLFLYLRSRQKAGEAKAVSISNPFELTTALKFALVFSVVLLGATAATKYLGARGTYAAGLLAGTTDVDAISLSMARLAGGEVPLPVAATTVFLGLASNTIVKAAMAAVLGGWAFGRVVAAAFGVTLLAGAVAVAIAWI
ncbi:MAG TPA: MgtC/SapB family protein [Anaeromyxobacteraceae bacterium]|nr:MgtC/SapB family protein [Anaeromyxobacteraceae bacterium]